MTIENRWNELSEEQQERARNMRTVEEILDFAKGEGYSLTDDELEALSGGGWGEPLCSEHCGYYNSAT